MSSPTHVSRPLHLAFALFSLASLPLACGGTVAPDTSAKDASPADVAAEVVAPACPPGTHLSKDLPRGACASGSPSCVYDVQDPCPDGRSTGPTVEWTCDCASGAWSCVGKAITLSICPPVDTPGDAGPPDVGSVTPGCPTGEPTSGQRCQGTSGYPDEHFYCHYFLGSDTCATEWKCTNSGMGEPTKFDIGTKNCSITVDFCQAGKPCGPVEPSGACIVECDRVCHCGAGGTLTCASTPCH